MLKEAFVSQENNPVPAGKPAVDLNMRGTPEEKAALTELINRVAESDFGREILEDARSSGYTVRMEDLGRTVKGVCRSAKKEIVLSTRMSPDVLVLTLAHEGRHAGQIARGAVSGYAPAYSLGSLVSHKRLMEADAVTASIVVAEDLLQKGDYMPVAMAHRDYSEMADAYEKSVEAGKPQTQAMTDCALKWYDNVLRKMAYEEDHFLTPLKEGFYAMNTTGVYRDLDAEAGLKAVCSFKGGMYFSDPDALKTPERAGMSSHTAEWIAKHVETCREKTGADVSAVVAGIPVYSVSEGTVAAKERMFGPSPEPLSDRGLKRIETAVKAGLFKKREQTALIARKRMRGGR